MTETCANWLECAPLTAGAAGRALWEVDELPVERVEHEPLIYVAWGLRDNFSFYDGSTSPWRDARRTAGYLRRASGTLGVDLPIEVLGQA